MGALAQLKLGGLQACWLIDLIQEFAGQDACFQDAPGQDCHSPVACRRQDGTFNCPVEQ